MIRLTNPATEMLIQEIVEDSPSQVSEKFQLAKTAQKIWAKVPLTDKIECIRKFRELIVKQEDELAKILTTEVGKAFSQSRNELKGLLTRIDFFIENIEGVLKEETVWEDKTQGMRELITHEPLGVIANISAWNYPYFVGSNVFIPALLTGNAVLYKPSEFALLTGLKIAELLHLSGIPKEVFQTVVGGPLIGEVLLQEPLNGIFFTGSYPVGKLISEVAGKRMIKVQLELGGKDPVYIAEDADLKSAVASTADGAFYNSGQSCCSVERIYVHANLYSAFVDEYVAEVAKFKIGDPLDEKTYIGPLTRPQQLKLLEKQVADAKAKGAFLHCGGFRRQGKGFYFEPTVFSNVNHSMEVMREESFGPIIGIQKVADDKEAVAMMNDTSYGLTAGIYSKSSERANKILSQINSGSVYWNCCDRVSPRLPWSGRGQSGIGSTLAKSGILTFLQPKAWHLRQK